MPPYFHKRNDDIFDLFKRTVSFIILAAFICTSVQMPVYAQGLSDQMVPLPAPGVMVRLSPEFIPAQLMGISIHQDNPLQFDFLIQKGDQGLMDDQKKEEYQKLIKYFLASLTIPDGDQWVNLSPYEKDRIIKDDFGKTQMGRDLLAQDYILKQITSSLIYPENGLGKKFWDTVYERAWKEYHTTDVPVNTFNKVWIVPDQAIVYESGNSAFILQSHLKVMLEEDYLSLEKHNGISATTSSNTHTIGSQVIREVILPELEKEVNEGKNFANLRQMFSGMILATWYKKALKESLLGVVYADKDKVKGIDQDPKANEVIYQRYLKAFKKGVFNYIKEDVDKYSNEPIPRKYFSGGWQGISRAMVVNDVATAQRPHGLGVELIVNSSKAYLLPYLLKASNALQQLRKAVVDRVKVNLLGETSNAAMTAHERSDQQFRVELDSLLKLPVVQEFLGRNTYLNLDIEQIANNEDIPPFQRFTNIKSRIRKAMDSSFEDNGIEDNYRKALTKSIESRFSQGNTKLELLIVDDQQSVSFALKLMAQHYGLNVTVANNGHEALTLLQDPTKKFDAVISDIDMPVMDGINLAENISKDPKIANLPIVYWTGRYEDHKAEIDALRRTALKNARLLEKPAEMSAMFNTLADLIEDQNTAAAAEGSKANGQLASPAMKVFVTEPKAKALERKINEFLASHEFPNALKASVNVTYDENYSDNDFGFDEIKETHGEGANPTISLYITIHPNLSISNLMQELETRYLKQDLFQEAQWKNIMQVPWSESKPSDLITLQGMKAQMRGEDILLKAGQMISKAEAGGFKAYDPQSKTELSAQQIVERLLRRLNDEVIPLHTIQPNEKLLFIDFNDQNIPDLNVPSTLMAVNLLSQKDLSPAELQALEGPSGMSEEDRARLNLATSYSPPNIKNTKFRRIVEKAAIGVVAAGLAAAAAYEGAKLIKFHHTPLIKPGIITTVEGNTRSVRTVISEGEVAVIVTKGKDQVTFEHITTNNVANSAQKLRQMFPPGSGATFNFVEDLSGQGLEADLANRLKGEIIEEHLVRVFAGSMNLVFNEERSGKVNIHLFQHQPIPPSVEVDHSYQLRFSPETRGYVLWQNPNENNPGNKTPKTNDKAMYGGIDFNAANFSLQIKRNGKGIPLPLNQQDMAQLSKVQGFIPDIIEIRPAINIPILGELQQKLQAIQST